MQNFWAVVNKKTDRVSRGMIGYNIFHTRSTARKALDLQMKKQAHNYKIEKLFVRDFDGGFMTYSRRD